MARTVKNALRRGHRCVCGSHDGCVPIKLFCACKMQCRPSPVSHARRNPCISACLRQDEQEREKMVTSRQPCAISNVARIPTFCAATTFSPPSPFAAIFSSLPSSFYLFLPSSLCVISPLSHGLLIDTKRHKCSHDNIVFLIFILEKLNIS